MPDDARPPTQRPGPTVRYLVDDVDRAVAFYTGLGFSLVDQMGRAFAVVERDGARLWLAGPTSSAARPMPDGRQPVPGGWNRLVLEVDGLDAVVAGLKADGGHFRNDIVVGPGGRQILLEDPDGNPIDLFEARR
jgi:catechol 2,3-dioxygenase-like lactoylglutathione lyase family enzyme